MKKKKVFSKILAIVLVLSLMLSAFPSISVFAQEASGKEKLTEKGELWQPESNSNALNFEGDLSIKELQSAKLSGEDTPEIVSQESIEENGHVNRLWEQEEDLNSIVFQNRDGTKTMYYYNYPVKYKDANGKIKDKSNKISQTSSGDFTNAENDINTYFPKKLNRNKGIELKFGEYVVEMAPDIKGNSGASRQTGHNKYFDPTEYVQYPNVFDESISLRYTPTFEGYKEDIVLSKYTGINEFSFRLYTDGLSLVMNEDGAYYLIDPLSGEVKTQIGDIVVYDSKPFDVPEEILNESVSNPTEEDFAKKEATLKELVESVPIDKNSSEELSTNLKEYFHQYKVETVKQDNEYLITVVVDKDYLTDSERVYPVYVDPTISVSDSGTGKTIQDAPIYANKPSTASGGNTYNVVGYQGSTYGVGRTLMKFPGLSSNSTYANLSSNQITSLQLHIYEGSGSTNNACIDLWQYNGTSWTESTARCNNVGWDSYSNNFTWNYINCSGWQTFDLTSMVATWKGSSSALDKGIMLKNYTSESSSGYSKHFMSTESGYQPYLTYTYNSVSFTPLTLGTPVSCSVAQTGEYWYTFTPAECMNYTFLSYGSTDTYGELYQGTTLIRSNDDGGSGTNFSISYTLVPNVQYKLKVRGYSTNTYGSTGILVVADEYGSFSSSATDYPINTQRLDDMNVSDSQFDVWPASSLSRYYGSDTMSRAEALSSIYEAALATSLGGLVANQPDAASALHHFLTGDGTNHTVSLNDLCNESTVIGNLRKSTIDALLLSSEKVVPVSATKTIYNSEIISVGSISDNTNWHNTLGGCEFRVKATVSRTSSNSFTATIEFSVIDFYDWDRTQTSMGIKPVSPSDMWELHHGGIAKNFITTGSSLLSVSWTTGQRWGSGATVTIN